MRLPKIKFSNLIGLAGVSPHESATAREWGLRLEWPMLLVAVWIPLQWYLFETGTISVRISHWFDWMVWLFFVGETALLTALVRNRLHYLLTNWVNLVIILGGIPLLWSEAPLVGALRNLRLLLMIVLLFGLSSSLRQVLMRNRLGPTLMVSLGVVLLSGILITRMDPAINNVWDGIWWAWVTVFTVGYGDIVPHSTAGRVYAGLLIMFGVVLISLLTANLAAFLIGGEVQKVEREERKADVLLRDIVQRLERVEHMLQEQRSTADVNKPSPSIDVPRPD
jgi:voltage-gated potassium channel